MMVSNIEAIATTTVDYWHAQSFASVLQREFEECQSKGDIPGMRARFYALANHYSRTLNILQNALRTGNTSLILTALRILGVQNVTLHHMHRIAPATIPHPLTLLGELRNRLIKDLIMNALRDSTKPIAIDALTIHVDTREFLEEINSRIVRQHLKDLIAKGHVKKVETGYARTRRAYHSTNLDDASLQAFLGQDLYEKFEVGGFPGLSNIVNRKKTFQKFFEKVTGSGDLVAKLFVASLVEFLGTESMGPGLGAWHHADLVGSVIPRPYQRDAFTLFRGYGYQGQLIEAPTGSGKTMIGMMVIQDWLGSMALGEAILVLVPSVNYEQQWVRELCYKSIGLKLSPNEVYAGTPGAYQIQRKETGHSPPILVMTYTALGQLGSPKGKGGFDKISVEKFLQGNNIRYVILDEVHKVAEKMRSVSAGVTRLLVEWLHDGSLECLSGFSGTATAYRGRFEELGLNLVYVMPSADLIAYGFVAPYAGFGVPFTYSDRERQVIDLLNRYKSLLREFIEIAGSENLRNAFIEIPMGDRITIGRDLLGMYASRKDKDDALLARFREWENGKELILTELPLISIVQMAEGLSDDALVRRMSIGLTEKEQRKQRRRLNKTLVQVKEIRKELMKLVFHSDITSRLEVRGFGTKLDAKTLRLLPEKMPTKEAVRTRTKDILSTTTVGLYMSLRSLLYRMGEGRVESISSIIKAERAVRKLNGTIVFGRGKRIRLESGVAKPSYAGVAGIFAQLLGQKNLTPMAVLSSEIYLPWSENKPLPLQIASHIKKEIMRSELGVTLFNFLTHGVEIPGEELTKLRKRFDGILTSYVKGLIDVGAPRPLEFNRIVIRKLRKAVDKIVSEGVTDKLNARLNIKNRHMKKWIETFFDYALVANRFLKAEVADLVHPSGAVHKFFIVRMPQGERKQLMYDIAARVMDSKSLSVDVIIVSRWARTGWNVIEPNLLIDATATRNVTAWQQLRGRAMRAMRTWDRECYETMMLLLGTRIRDIERKARISPPGAAETRTPFPGKIDEKTMNLLLDVHEKAKMTSPLKGSLAGRIKKGDLQKLTDKERVQLAVELMMHRNKVTHIYELVKAYGSGIQVRYDRRSDKWRRKQFIAAKHAHSYSVNPFSGEYTVGEVHTPLVYFHDPREYSPSKLRTHLAKKLRGRDMPIIEGWIHAVIAE